MKSIYLIVFWLSLLPLQAKPLQVYILAGQSNMQGHAKVSTFDHLGMDPKTQPLLKAMRGSDGRPTVCDRVWISSIGSAETEQTGPLTAGFGASPDKIGPEFTFGLTLQTLTEAPILLIKTAWGGKSLNTDFRPPSAGPYVFNDSQLAAFKKQGKDVALMTAEKEKETGVYYRLMIEHVQKVLRDIKRVVPTYDPAQGYEMAGLVWFQGWNDMVDGSTYPQREKPGGYDAYSTAMAHFIRDVRRELKSPQLPVVIGVLGVGGPTAAYGQDQLRYKATHEHFRQSMAAPADVPEFRGTVTALRTEQYWDMELQAARSKENDIKSAAKKQAKEGNLSAAQATALLDKLRSEGLSERERLILEKGISNQEFHYLGSAKILGGIGQGLAQAAWALRQPKQAQGPAYDIREVSGWQVHVQQQLLQKEGPATEKALVLLRSMLDQIIQRVPAPAVAELRKVPLYFSPAYGLGKGGAEYHPGADWLRENGRDPAMEKAVEFSNISRFEAEMKRMPNFALHELAHAYHHRTLPRGYENAEIQAAYQRAKASGRYDRVARSRGDGSPLTQEKAYAMANAMEYFAETTEALFSRNDFFPFNKEELQQHDPEVVALLDRLWGVTDHR